MLSATETIESDPVENRDQSSALSLAQSVGGIAPSTLLSPCHQIVRDEREENNFSLSPLFYSARYVEPEHLTDSNTADQTCLRPAVRPIPDLIRLAVNSPTGAHEARLRRDAGAAINAPPLSEPTARLRRSRERRDGRRGF
jgi:hypothetical protein